MLKMIVCADLNNGIGKDNKLPWSIKSEMEHFKNTTSGHTIVMGRKTYESIGRLLPNRQNIIFSNTISSVEGAIVTNDINKVLDMAKEQDIFVIGGKQIYKLFEPYYDELLISKLPQAYDCDTTLNLNMSYFNLIDTKDCGEFKIERYKSFKDKIMFAKPCVDSLKAKMITEKDTLEQKYHIKPKLSIIQVGNDYGSTVYVNNKSKLGKELGIDVELIKLDESITQDQLVTKINELNNDKTTHGILIQKPLPKHIDEHTINLTVSPHKDTDCFHPLNVGNLWTGNINENSLIPCTPYGVIKLLQFYGIELESKDVVIIGRSNIVAKPLAALMLLNNATVKITHSKTKDLAEKCKKADIIVSAVGKANFINESFVKDGQVIVDVGINRGTDGKVCGDVDFNNLIKKDLKITPVPFGIGPMTLIMLFHNLLICYKNAISK